MKRYFSQHGLHTNIIDACSNNNNNNNKELGHLEVELVQHTHSRGSHAFTHTLTSTQLQPRGAKCLLSYYRIWNQIFILNVREGGGANRSTRRKTRPPAC